jgi:hypothetical protein
MKLPASFSKFTKIELAALLSFVVYIVFPLNTPPQLVPLIDNPIGYMLVIVAGISLFVYSNPILGVLFIFVAYELLRRSNSHNIPRHSDNRVVVEHLPTHVPVTEISSELEKNANLQMLNPVKSASLEEEIISVRAPIGEGAPLDMVPPSYHPVAHKVNGASLW